MSKKKPFCLFPKKLANGQKIYYYTAYDTQGKRRQLSTGCKDQLEAMQICLKRLEEGKLIPGDRIVFKNYVKNWFTEDCPYYTPRIERGKVYSKSCIERNQKILEMHILPVFGEMRMDRIQTVDVEDWLSRFKKSGYAHNSINQFRGILRLIFNEAVRCGIISRNPVLNVLPYARNAKERGIFTHEECQTLFDRNRIDKIWKGRELHYLINYTAYLTGMRMGEVLALTEDDIHSDYIHIRHSWDRKYGLKSTKSGKERYAPVPVSLVKLLHEYAENVQGRFLFMAKHPFKPVDHKSVQNHFAFALKAIGIDNSQRRERAVSFHSWRHTANTRMKEAGVPEAVVRAVIGHSSAEVSEVYTHVDPRKVDLSWEVV
jgi:integrase